MKNIFKILITLLLSATMLNGGIIWDTTKAVGKGATIYGAKKAWQYYKKNKTKKPLTQNQKKKIFKKKNLHRNSKDYKGDSHVYKIKNKDKIHKIGESSQGVNKYGLSKRAEQQVRKIKRETGDETVHSKIVKEFDSKKDARDYETKLIERMRSIYGKNKDDKSILLGNKINR